MGCHKRVPVAVQRGGISPCLSLYRRKFQLLDPVRQVLNLNVVSTASLVQWATGIGVSLLVMFFDVDFSA